MNLVSLIVSALLALSAAANVGVPKGSAVTTAAISAGVAVPTPKPSPTPAPIRNDVINGGGPT